MCDYPFFIPQVVLFANSSLFWFKVTNEHREFRNYLFKSYLCKTAMGITVCGIGCFFRYTRHLSRQVSSIQSLQIQTSGLKIRAKILLPER